MTQEYTLTSKCGSFVRVFWIEGKDAYIKDGKTAKWARLALFGRHVDPSFNYDSPMPVPKDVARVYWYQLRTAGWKEETT
jgi:hypothetical protein